MSQSSYPILPATSPRKYCGARRAYALESSRAQSCHLSRQRHRLLLLPDIDLNQDVCCQSAKIAIPGRRTETLLIIVLTVFVNLQKLYVTMFPCNECAKLLIQAGIKEVIFHEVRCFCAQSNTHILLYTWSRCQPYGRGSLISIAFTSTATCYALLVCEIIRCSIRSAGAFFGLRPMQQLLFCRSDPGDEGVCIYRVLLRLSSDDHFRPASSSELQSYRCKRLDQNFEGFELHPSNTSSVCSWLQPQPQSMHLLVHRAPVMWTLLADTH